MACERFRWIINIIAILNSFVICEQSNDVGATPNILGNVTQAGHVTYTHSDADTCRLVPESSTVTEQMKKAMNGGNTFLRLELSITGHNGLLNDTSTDLYTPLEWTVITGPIGKSMLLLKESFDSMSVQTLGVGVTNVMISLKQEPADCLQDQLNIAIIEKGIRLNILHNFGANAEVPENVEVCNRHVIATKGNYGSLVHTCCRSLPGGNLECNEVQESVWLNMLVKIILFLQVLAVLYSPMLLPESLYRLRDKFVGYVYDTGADQEMNPLDASEKNTESVTLRLNVKVTSTKPSPESQFQLVQIALNQMRQFKESLRGLKRDKVFSIRIRTVEIAVKAKLILQEGYVPVGLFYFLKNFFVRCKMRKDIPSLESCCKEDILKILPCKGICRWYECLSFLSGIFFGSLITIPWLFRVWFYYTHEHNDVEFRRYALVARNLSMPFTGSLVSYFSPLHPLFIFIYILILVEVVLLVILPPRLRAKLRFIVRQCFRDMKNTQKLDACASFVSYAFLPCQKLGIFGCLVFLVWMLFSPLYLAFFAVKVFPVLNVSYRLFVNLIYYLLKTVHPSIVNVDIDFGFFSNFVRSVKSVLVTDLRERNSRTNKCTHAFSLAMGLVTIWMLLILAWECVYFYIECAVYTVCGIILNSRFLMRYITLLVVICFYAYDCISGVAGRYVSFNKTICAQIEKLIGDKVKDVAMCMTGEQENTAFKVAPRSGKENHRMKLVRGSKHGLLKWQTQRLLFFLDKNDISHISKNFFLTFAKGSHYACPGPLHVLYLKAFVDFFLILVFLTFVFIVIIAFGKTKDASDSSQSLATLASGFLPFVFRKFLFKAHPAPALDPSKLKWQATFREQIDSYEDKWAVSDVITSASDECNHSINSSASGVQHDLAKADIDSASHRLLSEHEEGNVDDVDILAVVDENSNIKLYVPLVSENTIPLHDIKVEESIV